MSFSDTDPLEEDMGIRCEDMTPDQLVSYIKSYQEAFGLNLPVEGLPERSVFKGMQRLYGKRDAGLIVKWVFYKHKGRWDGEPVRYQSFAKGRRWWVDKMYTELQDELRRESARTATGSGLGTVSLLDL